MCDIDFNTEKKNSQLVTYIDTYINITRKSLKIRSPLKLQVHKKIINYIKIN